MSGGIIRHDRAWWAYRDGEPVVTTCRRCGPSWQSLSLSEAEARERGAAHLERTHGFTPSDAREPARLAAARGAITLTPLADRL